MQVFLESSLIQCLLTFHISFSVELKLVTERKGGEGREESGGGGGEGAE